ncbi:hypothetical protein [Halosimplex sp. J119]
MQRRRVLRGLAALAAGAAAGCTGANDEVPVTAPEPPAAVRGSGDSPSGGDGGRDDLQFAVPERTFDETDDGDLVVVLTVENQGQRAREATVTITVSAGEKTFTPTEHVSLDAGASTELRTVVPVPYSEFDADPGFDMTIEPGSPATPLPEGTVTPYPEDRETATDGSAETGDSTGTGGPAATAATGEPTDTEQAAAEDATISSVNGTE